MRIAYLIGALTPGGSERQLSELAAGMAERGHEVEVLGYDGPGAYDTWLAAQGVRVRTGAGGARAHKVRAVRRWFREFAPDLAHGFMKRASSLAILANLPARRRKVVASDFSTATYSRRQCALWGALAFFHLADRVVTQTEINRRSLARLAPLLRRKLVVVRNGVDTVRFHPARRESGVPFRFVCVGSVYKVKNPLGVVEAVRLLRDRGAPPFRVDWVGRSSRGGSGEPTLEYRSALTQVETHGLGDLMAFKGETLRVEAEYHAADALLHVSVQEGFPNAVVEAMASGLPIVVSRVSDLPLIVQEAANGFLCDARDPASIADAMARMLSTPVAERRAMGERSRELAMRWFGRERFLDEYERLYRALLGLDSAIPGRCMGRA